MKTVNLILKYQEAILKHLSRQEMTAQELEYRVLKLNNICDFDCYIHALKDLISNGKVNYTTPVLRINS